MKTTARIYRMTFWEKPSNSFKLLMIFFLIGVSNSIYGQDIKVMSFNIRYNNPADGINSWENRHEWLNNYIRFSGADLIGGQEVMHSQLTDMNKALSSYSYIGIARNGKEEGEYCPIFYKSDRFEVLDHNTFWLSPTPSEIDSQGWDAALPRIVTWGKFRDKIQKKEFFLFNTHFDHRGEVARVESARLLIRMVEEIAGGSPVFVTGDFNFPPDTKAYEILTNKDGSAALTDAMIDAQISYGPKYTFNGFRLEPEAQGERIDFIFIKGKIDVLKFQVVDGQRGGKYISDHFPVLIKADFTK